MEALALMMAMEITGVGTFLPRQRLSQLLTTYLSPEQLGAEDLNGHSDLFSLGVTLYELLAGEVPFKATNIAVLMTKITTEEAQPISHIRAGIPPSVDAVLAKALAKKPQDRFSCGAEMAIALRNCARYS